MLVHFVIKELDLYSSESPQASPFPLSLLYFKGRAVKNLLAMCVFWGNVFLASGS